MSPHKIERTALLFVHGMQGYTICSGAITEVSTLGKCIANLSHIVAAAILNNLDANVFYFVGGITSKSVSLADFSADLLGTCFTGREGVKRCILTLILLDQCSLVKLNGHSSVVFHQRTWLMT